ncbi:MAG: universal stress protein [Flavobacterium sp.]|nr:universal stress protein [Flavobacterium sp.]
MKKRFIVLVDFSEYSKNLIKFACEWSVQVDAEVLLLHQTLVFTPALSDNESRKQHTLETNVEAMQDLKALASEHISQVNKLMFYVSEDSLNTTLKRFVAEPFENLIFVGLKGTGLFKQILLGSVALQVIENINKSVVAIPKEIDTFLHPKIFVAVTEKHPLNILELNNFLKFINTQNTTITFFYLAKPNEKTIGIEKQLRELSDLFSERFTTDFAIFEGVNPFDDIKQLINNKTEEVLIVQKGTRFFTDQLFRKFLVNDMVYEGQTPLVVLP